MIKAVIFDMDGVLIESFEAWLRAMDLTAKEFGFEGVKAEEFRKVYGQSTQGDIEMFMPGRTVDEVEEAYSRNFPKFIEFTNILPNVKELLVEIKKRKIKTLVATNTNSIIAPKQLEAVGIRQYFDYIIGGDEVENPKPHPEMILKALEKLGEGKEEVLYIGDSVYDVGAGKAADVFTIGRGIDADARVEDVIEVLGYIDKKC